MSTVLLSVNRGQRECELLTRFHCWVSCLILLLTSLSCHHCQGTLIEKDILVKNYGLGVPIGRRVFISPEDHLKINVSNLDKCRVTVLQSDLLFQRPGILMPKEFPCDFPDNSVHYTHHGAKDPSEDYLHLMIHYESSNQTLIIPFVFHVQIQDVQYKILTKNTPLTVRQFAEYSDVFSDQNTVFSYDTDNQQCRLTLVSIATGLPRSGYIANDTSKLAVMDCDKVCT